MGKNGKFGKDYGKVVGKDSKNRPGWKGPAYVKKPDPQTKAKPAQAEKSESVAEQLLPVDLQQLLLNICRDAFPDVLLSDTLQPLLQSVKSALYERDFARTFGREDHLQAYSIRWSPSRALCYASILIDLRKHLYGLTLDAVKGSDGGSLLPPASTAQPTLRAVCFGGGAAEVIAFGGFLRFLNDCAAITQAGSGDQADIIEELSNLSLWDKTVKVDLLLIDSAEWNTVVLKLHQGLVTPPPLSKYASASARQSNRSLIPAEMMATTFRSEDLLQPSQGQLLDDLVGKGPMLLTLLFTLNELYTTSISKTTTFLLHLTTTAKPGTLLLVVDSPGSYSETTVGSEAKKYPMKWLLDHTLLETEKTRGEESIASWEKVASENSQWFRIPERLRYPIPLENMRYQVHLYRRI